MNRDEWIKHHGFTESDMELIDSSLTFGGKITAINAKPLDYETVTYNRS